MLTDNQRTPATYLKKYVYVIGIALSVYLALLLLPNDAVCLVLTEAKRLSGDIMNIVKTSYNKRWHHAMTHCLRPTSCSQLAVDGMTTS